jgi:tryptophan-rich sensory protein
MTPARRRLWKPVIVAAGAALAVGLLGALVTDLSPWYYNLRKPAWQPPDWLFGPAWTLIFALAAAAGVEAWRKASDRRMRAWVIALFSFNIVLNIGWSWLFFRLQRPDWALVEVVFLWASIAALIRALWPYARRASLLLVPYLLWVTFASALNFAVVQLNAPFR